MVEIKNVLLRKKSFSGYIFIAGDIDKNLKVDITDYVRLNNYILRKVNTLIDKKIENE